MENTPNNENLMDTRLDDLDLESVAGGGTGGGNQCLKCREYAYSSAEMRCLACGATYQEIVDYIKQRKENAREQGGDAMDSSYHGIAGGVILNNARGKSLGGSVTAR